MSSILPRVSKLNLQYKSEIKFEYVCTMLVLCVGSAPIIDSTAPYNIEYAMKLLLSYN